jgi:hypothetical protein
MPSIPADVITKVRQYAESNMDALVTIVRGRQAEMDETTLMVGGTTSAVQVYGEPVPDGQVGTRGAKARIHSVSGQGSISLGPGQINLRTATVSIPWGATPPQRDDIILVRDAGQDQALVGAALRIVEVSGGTAFGDARRLQCTLWGKSSTWDGDGS